MKHFLRVLDKAIIKVMVLEKFVSLKKARKGNHKPHTDNEIFSHITGSSYFRNENEVEIVFKDVTFSKKEA